jgi:hypothetical protein
MCLFRLLTLPFVLLGSLLSLVGVTRRMMLFPLRILVRNPLLFLAIVVSVLLYIGFKDTPTDAPPPSDKQAKSLPAGVAPFIEKATQFEDGNSNFATDLYKTMTDEERKYYTAVFYQIMSKVPDGKAQGWAFFNIHGTLTPTSTFTNRSGEVCRKFSEVLKVHRVQQTLQGTACANGPGRWCKLKLNATPACGLGGKSPGMLDRLMQPVTDLF